MLRIEEMSACIHLRLDGIECDGSILLCEDCADMDESWTSFGKTKAVYAPMKNTVYIDLTNQGAIEDVASSESLLRARFAGKVAHHGSS